MKDVLQMGTISPIMFRQSSALGATPHTSDLWQISYGF